MNLCRIKEAICLMRGHEWISGHGFLYREVALDLRWKYCIRCSEWWCEGDVQEQFLVEQQPGSEVGGK